MKIHTPTSLYFKDMDVCMVGGPEGNRTPVRKPLDMTFFVDSRSLSFPTHGAGRQAPHVSSPFLHDRLKGERPMHVYH